MEFPSFEMVQQLTGEIMNLSNNARMWILKGHTPEELFQEKKEHLQPLPAVPFAAAEADYTIGQLRELSQSFLEKGFNSYCCLSMT